MPGNGNGLGASADLDPSVELRSIQRDAMARRGATPECRWDQVLRKGDDLSEAIVGVAASCRSRKILDWKALAEICAKQLRSIQQPSVATTG